MISNHTIFIGANFPKCVFVHSIRGSHTYNISCLLTPDSYLIKLCISFQLFLSEFPSKRTFQGLNV